MADTLGRMRVVEVGVGWVVFILQPQEYHYNPVGFVHGGLACTLLDSAMACAVHSTLEQGVGYTSLDITVRFVRGITAATGTLQAVGEIENMGRRVATATGRLLDSSGKLLASGSTTCLILSNPHPPAGTGPSQPPAGLA